MKFQAECYCKSVSGKRVKMTHRGPQRVFYDVGFALSAVLLCSHAGRRAVAGLLGYKHPPRSDEGFNCSCHSVRHSDFTGGPQVRASQTAALGCCEMLLYYTLLIMDDGFIHVSFLSNQTLHLESLSAGK